MRGNHLSDCCQPSRYLQGQPNQSIGESSNNTGIVVGIVAGVLVVVCIAAVVSLRLWKAMKNAQQNNPPLTGPINKPKVVESTPYALR
jgi:cell division protein FtsN